MIGRPARWLSVAKTTERARCRSTLSKLETHVASPSPMSEVPRPLKVPAKNESYSGSPVSARRRRVELAVDEVVVVGEREDRRRRAVEDDEADALALEALDERLERRHQRRVVGRHRAGDVEAQHDVAAAGLRLVDRRVERARGADERRTAEQHGAEREHRHADPVQAQRAAVLRQLGERASSWRRPPTRVPTAAT